MPFIIRSLFSLIVLIGIVFIVTHFSEPIQKQAGSVLGIQIAPKQSEALPEKLQKDVSSSLDSVTEKSMELKVEDIVIFFQRTDKVIKDYHHMQKQVETTINDFVRQRTED